MSELRGGARYWLNESETTVLMEHNRQFQQLTPSAQFFLDYFEVCELTDPDVQWMTATELLTAIKKRAGSAYTVPSTIQFGRTIREIPDIVHRRSKYGEQYCIRPRK